MLNQKSLTNLLNLKKNYSTKAYQCISRIFPLFGRGKGGTQRTMQCPIISIPCTPTNPQQILNFPSLIFYK